MVQIYPKLCGSIPSRDEYEVEEVWWVLGRFMIEMEIICHVYIMTALKLTTGNGLLVKRVRNGKIKVHQYEVLDG